MGCSGYTPKWQRVLRKYFPTLFKQCIGKNFHWRWEKWCFCCLNECYAYCSPVLKRKLNWRGGVYSFFADTEIYYSCSKHCFCTRKAYLYKS